MKIKMNISAVLSVTALCSFFSVMSAQTVELSLDRCKEMAAENNPYVRNAGLDIMAARAQKQEALAEYFPKVSITAFSFHAFSPMLEIGLTDILGHSDFTHNLQNIINNLAGQYGFNPVYSTLKYGVTASVSVMQPIFAGGRIVTGNRLAALGVEAATLQGNVQKRKTSEDIEKSYWQVISLREKLMTLDALDGLLDTLYRDVSSAVAAGLATESDLLQVRLKKNEIRSGKIKVNNAVRLSKMNLFNSIGQQYNPYTTVQMDSVPYIDDIVLSGSLADLQAPEEYYRPEEEVAAELDETRLLELSVESKRLEKRMALGEALPQLAIGVGYGYNRLVTNGSFNGSVYAMLQVPISDWGKISKKMKRLDIQMQKAENEREYINQQLLLQVRQLWMDLTASWEQLLVSQESIAAAESTVRQLSDHYKAGLIPISELLQSQTQLRQTADQYVDNCIAYRTALQAYLGRTGK